MWILAWDAGRRKVEGDAMAAILVGVGNASRTQDESEAAFRQRVEKLRPPEFKS